MRVVPLAVAAGLACFLASGGAAMATCKATPDALFVDQFKTLDDTWGNYQNYDVEDGKLVIKPPAGYNTSTINNTSLYDEVDICVEMSAEAPVAEGSCGSIIFWAVDYDNYYSFQVSTEGQASFWRRQRGKWLNQVSWQDAQGAEKGATVINELRVITGGKGAKLYVNGQLFKEVKGQPPKDGSLVGLLACSPNDASARITFGNLVVNTPSAETEPVAEKTRGETSGGDNPGAGAATGGGGEGSKGGANPGGASGGGSGGGSDNGGAPSVGAGAAGGGASGGASGSGSSGGDNGAAPSGGAGAAGGGASGGASGGSSSGAASGGGDSGPASSGASGSGGGGTGGDSGGASGGGTGK
jgi:hypothetical protein